MMDLNRSFFIKILLNDVFRQFMLFPTEISLRNSFLGNKKKFILKLQILECFLLILEKSHKVLRKENLWFKIY